MNQSQLNTIAQKVGTPTYIYDERVLLENIERLNTAAGKHKLDDRLDIYVSYFANSNPNLVRLLPEQVGLTLQSFEEYHQLEKFGLKRPFQVSPSFLSNEEIDRWDGLGTIVNLASLDEVTYFLTRHPKKRLSFRLDLTSDGTQRMGIKKEQLAELHDVLTRAGATPYSFHIYAGTGSSLVEMKRSLDLVLNIYLHHFPQVEEINLGGGFGFNYIESNPDKKHFPWDDYFAHLEQRLQALQIPGTVRFAIEPGRDIWTDTGILLTSVKRVVSPGKAVCQIATDGSYVHLPSAAVRGRQHRLRFYSTSLKEFRPGKKQARLNGASTLSSDYVLPGDIYYPDKLATGDFVAVLDTGSYGATQHMEFLNQRPCPEVVIRKNGAVELITKRGDWEDRARYMLLTPKPL